MLPSQTRFATDDAPARAKFELPCHRPRHVCSRWLARNTCADATRCHPG